MIKVLIIEDDYPFAVDVDVILSKFNTYVTEIASTFEEAVEALYNRNFDLVLADIYLDKDYTAFDVFEKVEINIPIIFFSTNNDIETYLQAKKFDTYIYLVKPVDPITLISAVENCVKDTSLSTLEKKVVFLKDGRKNIPLEIESINFISTNGNYCLIDSSKHNIITRSTMSKLVEKIDSSAIVRVHRQFAVNINKIESVDFANNKIFGFSERIDIGRKYKKDFKELLN